MNCLQFVIYSNNNIGNSNSIRIAWRMERINYKIGKIKTVVLVEKNDIRSPDFERHNSENADASELFLGPSQLIIVPFLTNTICK